MAERLICPKRDELHEFLLGQLPADRTDRLQDHLAQCAPCLDTIASLKAEDTLVGAWRAQAQEVPASEDEQVAALIQKLSGIARLPSAISAAGSDNPAPTAVESHELLAPPLGPEEIGRLGPYRVLKVLGVGGMGIVFEAEDPHLHRRVALKVMKPDLAARPADRQRFVREAQAMAALEHDHIVTIHQVGEDRGVPFLAMQLLKGETLEGTLRRAEGVSPPAPMPIAESLRITREIATGLAAAHSQGLTHRDIKPANIWLERSGRVKILDFGLARPQLDDTHLTQTGLIAGTPAYMSPEQAAGQPVDHLSDLFSLGSVLYRLLTGRLPFAGPSTLAVLRALAVQQPLPPHAVNPDVPPALSALTMRLLAKEPRDRPQSADAVLQSLAEIERAQVSEALRRKSQPKQLVAGRGRRFGLLAAVILLLVGPLALWFGPTVYRFATNQGLLVVETDDPAVEFIVKQNGNLVKVVDRKAGQQLTLKAGTYELELSGGKSGLKLQTDHFTLTRGGREIARVRREAAAPDGAPHVATSAQANPLPFVVLGSGKKQQAFATLAEAVAAAKSGDTIEVRDTGPVIKESIFVSGKALTIRAAPGSRPVLEFSAKSLGEGWDKYVRLQTDASLVLEGLEIRRVGVTGEKVKRAEWAVVCKRARLCVANCRFVVSTEPGTVALWADKSALCEVRNSEFVCPGCGGIDWVCPATGRMIWDNNVLVGGTGAGCHLVGIVHDVAVQLTRSTFVGPAWHVNLEVPPQAALGEGSQPGPPFRVDAADDVFDSGYVVGFFQSYPIDAPGPNSRPSAEAEALLRRLVAWQGQRNVYAEHTNLLALGAGGKGAELVPLEPTRVRRTLDDFRQFWGPTDADSLKGRILHQGEQVATKAATAPDELTPSDFRLRSGSTGFQAGADGRDLGADVDQVGPGEAYERWKKTPAYQEWLHQSGLMP